MNDRQSGPVVWLCIIGGTCLSLFLLRQVLWLVVPFMLGVILYYMLMPLTIRLLLLGVSRNVAAMTVAGSFLLLLVLTALFSAPWIFAHVGSWQDMISRYLDGGTAFVRNSAMMLEHRFAALQKLHLSDLVDMRLNGYSDNFAQQHVADFLVSVVSWLPSLILAPFLAFFFLRDGRRFKKFLSHAVPNAFFERTLYLLHEVDQTARRYFQGLLKLTVIDTLLLAGGLWVIGISAPLALGLIAAVLAWIPFIGSILGCVMVVLVAATDAPNDPLVAYGAIGVFVLVRLLDDFVFMPLTLGRSLRMHPLITVLMIFIGGAVAGVAGLMLVLPLLGIAMAIGETLGQVITDPRLRARHRQARVLRTRQASIDLI
ncbi:MAG TPA: AI-2E family transporter [Burkholderiaceae bacterium]